MKWLEVFCSVTPANGPELMTVVSMLIIKFNFTGGVPSILVCLALCSASLKSLWFSSSA